VKTQVERERPRSAEEHPSQGASVSHRAVVRLRGGCQLSPETLLAMAEGVRRALRLVGVVDVQIELDTNDAGTA
jgi:hypothetical protein